MSYLSRLHNRSQNLRPPDLYEYYVDNFWFEDADIQNQRINEPLRGSHQADAVSSLRGFFNRGVKWLMKNWGIC